MTAASLPAAPPSGAGRLTYARARLWLGISGVGAMVILAAAALLLDLPGRLLAADPAQPLAAAVGQVVLAMLVPVALLVPLDVLGGRVVVRDRRATGAWLAGWGRGVLAQLAVWALSAALLLAAGRLGGAWNGRAGAVAGALAGPARRAARAPAGAATPGPPRRRPPRPPGRPGRAGGCLAHGRGALGGRRARAAPRGRRGRRRPARHRLHRRLDRDRAWRPPGARTLGRARARRARRAARAAAGRSGMPGCTRVACSARSSSTS
jgi:hypothetical protein